MGTDSRSGLWRQAWAAVMLAVMAVAAAPLIAAADPDPTPDAPELLDHGAAFLTPRLTVWAGRTQVLPFKAAQTSDADRRFTATTDHPERLHILSEPAVLAGYDIGFVRVRGLAVGDATLTLGGASAAIEVKAPPIAAPAVPTGPIITAPATDSVAWGEIAVGVELFSGLVRPGEPPARVALLLPDGAAVPVATDTHPGGGPWRRLVFVLDTSQMGAGPVELVAEARCAGETPVRSRPVLIHVVHPDAAAGALVSGEAESLVDVPRPDRYGGKREPEQRPLRVRKDAQASGGRFVDNHGARPPLTIAVKVEEVGWYQLMLRVGADFGGGAYPTVGVRVDNGGRAETMSRLVGPGWHRTPIGRPVRLEAGEHSLIAWFENDFSSSGEDRNLRIDTYALLRLDELPATGPVTIAAPGDARLSVVMQPALEGRTLAAGVTVRGLAAWRRALSADAPVVSVLVNGEAVMSQQTATPTFVLDRGHFEPGRNVIELEARLGTGLVTRSGPQTVTLAPFDGGPPVARRTRYFAAAGAGWGDSMAGRITADGRGDRHVAAFYSGGAETLALPEDLAGRFEVQIEARGDSYDGRPVARVTLVRGGQETPVGDAEVSGGYRVHDVGEVELVRGPKAMRIAFTNDKFDPKSKQDRNLFVAAVLLREKAPRDVVAPTAAIAYPAGGQEVFGVGAVVADAADDRGIAWAQLLLDGQATGLRVTPTDGGARMLLPLIVRGLSPGEHNVTVRVADAAGHTRDAGPVRVVVARERPAEMTRYERAVRLLNRFGYGPEPAELAAVLTMGEQAYLKDRLWRTWDDPAERAAWCLACMVHDNDNSRGAVAHRALRYVLTSPNPVRTRLVMWVDNHFSTWMRKTGAARKADEFAAFARLGVAPFGDLLLASATSPSMLIYLDQHRSFANRINENYAREIMELHTLGVGGGYTQTDVTRLSNLITGWTFSDEAPLDGASGYEAGTFRYLPRLNDPGAREVFGMRFAEADNPADQYRRVHKAIEMLASHPSTARHISRELVEHYVAIPAPQPLVDDLAAVFMRSGGDLRRVLLALGQHPALFARDLPPRVTRPLDFAVRIARVTGYDSPGPILGYLDRSAVGLFDHDTPDGYPQEDRAYTDSNMTLQRWRLTRDLQWPLYRLVPAPLRSPPEAMDPALWRQRLVDVLAVGITGRLLGDRSNEAVLGVLQKTGQTGNARVLLIAGLVAQMPEAMMR